MGSFATTPPPPYYAVIFTSLRTAADPDGYETMANRMVELAALQPGFIGLESARDSQGVGITVSYWESPQAIRDWKRHAEHRLAQQHGKAKWYAAFRLRVCKIEREYGFDQNGSY